MRLSQTAMTYPLARLASMIMVHEDLRWCGAVEATPETAAVWGLTCRIRLRVWGMRL